MTKCIATWVQNITKDIIPGGKCIFPHIVFVFFVSVVRFSCCLGCVEPSLYCAQPKHFCFARIIQYSYWINRSKDRSEEEWFVALRLPPKQRVDNIITPSRRTCHKGRIFLLDRGETSSGGFRDGTLKGQQIKPTRRRRHSIERPLQETRKKSNKTVTDMVSLSHWCLL